MRKMIFWYKISDFLLPFYYFHFYFTPSKCRPMARAAWGGPPLPPPFATPLTTRLRLSFERLQNNGRLLESQQSINRCFCLRNKSVIYLLKLLTFHHWELIDLSI